jgi:hypothetical protein
MEVEALRFVIVTGPAMSGKTTQAAKLRDETKEVEWKDAETPDQMLELTSEGYGVLLDETWSAPGPAKKEWIRAFKAFSELGSGFLIAVCRDKKEISYEARKGATVIHM